MQGKNKLDMNVISNASLNLTDEVINHIMDEGGESNYDDLKKIIEKDPHHQTNNGVRLDLLERTKDSVKITELGKQYYKSSQLNKLEILRKQAMNIKIIEICVKRLRIKKKLKKNEVTEILQSITKKNYSNLSSRNLSTQIFGWIIYLRYGEKEKEGSLKWKG